MPLVAAAMAPYAPNEAAVSAISNGMSADLNDCLRKFQPQSRVYPKVLLSLLSFSKMAARLETSMDSLIIYLNSQWLGVFPNISGFNPATLVRYAAKSGWYSDRTFHACLPSHPSCLVPPKKSVGSIPSSHHALTFSRKMKLVSMF